MKMTDGEIDDLVLRAIRNLNLARRPDEQLAVSSTAPVFGPDSPLDSLGLVALLMDIEEALGDNGFPVTLSDARAMSQSSSPFRHVPALTAYIRDAINSRP